MPSEVQQRQIDVREPARDLLQLFEEDGVAGDVGTESGLAARVLELEQASHHWRQHFGDNASCVGAGHRLDPNPSAALRDGQEFPRVQRLGRAEAFGS